MMPGGDPTMSPAKYIYVARNPKDVAVSLFYHYRRRTSIGFTGDWDCFFEYFISGRAKRGSWCDHVLGWWEHKGICNLKSRIPQKFNLLLMHVCACLVT